jgi:hypothetical protein
MNTMYNCFRGNVYSHLQPICEGRTETGEQADEWFICTTYYSSSDSVSPYKFGNVNSKFLGGFPTNGITPLSSITLYVCALGPSDNVT